MPKTQENIPLSEVFRRRISQPVQSAEERHTVHPMPSYSDINIAIDEEVASLNTLERPSHNLLLQLPSRNLDTLDSKTAETQKTTRERNFYTLPLKGTLKITDPTQIENIMSMLANNSEIMEDSSGGQEKLRNTLKELNTSLTLKRQMKLRMALRRRKSQKTQNCYDFMVHKWKIMGKNVKSKLKEYFYYLELWGSHLKHVEGYFGTGVVSYFRFLRFLFLLNFPVFVIMFFFIIFPQIMFGDRVNDSVPKMFSGLEILTGLGTFEHTLLYYGFFSNRTINHISGLYYHMPAAYLLTQIFCYLLCLIVIAVSMVKSYRMNFIESRSDIKTIFVQKVFCGWDFGITSLKASKLCHQIIFNELEEYLAYYHKKNEGKPYQKIAATYLSRLMVHLLVVGLLIGIAFVVRYFFMATSFKTDVTFLREMSLALCLTIVNYLSPYLFSFLAIMEKYDNPRTELTITMLRDAVLKGVSLGAFLYYWFTRNPQSIYEQNIEALLSEKCWETLLGSEIYRLVIVDFIFFVAMTLFFEFFPSLVRKCLNSKTIFQIEFNIARNTLGLIYSQTLCWIGWFFSPLLPLLMIIKFFLIFYFKRLSVMQCCLSKRKWRGARAKTIFLIFTFSCLLLSIISTGYAIVFVPPSENCGPFRHLHSTYMYHTVLRFLENWKYQRNFGSFVTFITMPGCVAALLVIMCVSVYYLHAVAAGHHKMVQLLKEQLLLEGKDKVFLLKMYDAATHQLQNQNKFESAYHNAATGGIQDYGDSLQVCPRPNQSIQPTSCPKLEEMFCPHRMETSFASSQRPLLESFDQFTSPL